MKQTLNVALGERAYPIYIGPGLLNQVDLLLEHIKSKRVAIVSNTTVAPLYLETVTKPLVDAKIDVVEIILPDGEKYKNSETLNKIYDALLESRCERNTTIIALGGGVIGDLTGYAAATYLRGVPFIQIPTTLLSQVDSSVGGKTGINHPLGKNMVGAFYQPHAVIIDTDVLTTLPPREYAAGIAEVIKYGLIRKPEFFDWLVNHRTALVQREVEALVYAIEQSCLCKAEVVAIDELEGGLRAILNLGHTFGHAIETFMGYGEWLHGEAVAAGMMVAAILSEKMAVTDVTAEDVFALREFLLAFGLPVTIPERMTTDDFLSLMARDKKAEYGKITLILLHAVGEAFITSDTSAQLIEAALDATR